MERALEQEQKSGFRSCLCHNDELCDLELVTPPLWASGSPFVRKFLSSLYLLNSTYPSLKLKGTRKLCKKAINTMKGKERRKSVSFKQ